MAKVPNVNMTIMYSREFKTYKRLFEKQNEGNNVRLGFRHPNK
jgi:hypothetical protein